jgi:hypothetical protein
MRKSGPIARTLTPYEQHPPRRSRADALPLGASASPASVADSAQSEARRRGATMPVRQRMHGCWPAPIVGVLVVDAYTGHAGGAAAFTR